MRGFDEHKTAGFQPDGLGECERKIAACGGETRDRIGMGLLYVRNNIRVGLTHSWSVGTVLKRRSRLGDA